MPSQVAATVMDSVNADTLSRGVDDVNNAIVTDDQFSQSLHLILGYNATQAGLLFETANCHKNAFHKRGRRSVRH